VQVAGAFGSPGTDMFLVYNPIDELPGAEKKVSGQFVVELQKMTGV
jgi:hypothetical protein